MNIKKKYMLTGIGIGIAVLAFLFTFALLLGPTRGTKIQHYTTPKKALLVIDMQEDYIGKTAKAPFPYKNASDLVISVNLCIEKARQLNWNVIYIRQEFDGVIGRAITNVFSHGTAKKGQPGTEIDSRINIISDQIFGKPKGDSFSNPDFEKYLVENRIDQLVLCGLDAEFCIYHTAIGAANRGYKVTIVSDAIAMKDQNKLGNMLRKYENKGFALMRTGEI